MQALACPDDADLSDLMAGRVDELSENSIVQHLQDCEPCRQRAQQLEQQRSDSILQLLQAKDGDSAYYGEPDCRWSTTRALAVIAGGPQDETQPEQFDLPLELGDYRILESIAQGGMGVVYRAQHLRLGRDVAVKIISGRRLADRRAVQRFEAEMRTLGQLSHPNIVAALDARELAGQPVLVMEYVDGMDLSKIAQRLGPLPAAVVAAIGGAVAAALDYANRNGLIHRDIKPSNVMINSLGQIKLLDLGLARLQASSVDDNSGTLTGLALGTADYMSPEQIHNARSVDARADLYSLGCALYKLLTGSTPYSGPRYATNFSKLQGHVSEQPICVPPQYRDGCQPLVELIQSLTAKQRDNRPVSAEQISAQLTALGQGANLAQLVSLAQSTPDLSQAPIPTDGAAPPAKRPECSRQSIVPPWLRWTIAASCFPAGIAMGIWLTIKKLDGTNARIQIPAGAAATIDPQGNVNLSLMDSGFSSGYSDAPPPINRPADDHGNLSRWEFQRSGATGDSGDSSARFEPGVDSSPFFRQPDIVFQQSDPATITTPTTELPKVWSRQSSPLQPQLQAQFGPNQPFQRQPQGNQSIDDRELESMMKNSTGRQAIYRCYSYEQWLGLLIRDQDVDTACIAVKALNELAQWPEQQREVAKEILRKSRKWGSLILAGTRPEGTWMETYFEEIPKLKPAVLLTAVAEELEQCNKHSYCACYITLMNIMDHRSESSSRRIDGFSSALPLRSDELSKDLVSKLYLNLDSAHDRLLIENQLKESFIRYAMRLASRIQLPYSEMPAVMQAHSKRYWEWLTVTAPDEINRSNNYPFGLKFDSGHSTFFPVDAIDAGVAGFPKDHDNVWRPTASAWQPFWFSLPAAQRQPLRILHEIFQDQVLTDPEMDVPSTLAALSEVSEVDKLNIKLFIVRRLADSDFDHPRDARRIVWPEVLKWCVQVGVMDGETSQQTLQIIGETNSNIAKVVGEQNYHVLELRRAILRTGRKFMGELNEFPGTPDQIEAIQKQLELGTQRLADLFELPADARQFTYRLPGSISLNKPDGIQAVQPE